MSQKKAFLDGEGDAWFERNRRAIGGPAYLERDPIIVAVKDILASGGFASAPLRMLEIGCSNGRRLEQMRDSLAVEVAGIEPSGAAVSDAVDRGLAVKVGTADRLDYQSASFDIVVFGFCLYLCDRADLFQIGSEAHRVLKTPGWLIIHDFYAPTPTEGPYHHLNGVVSRKMDYRTLFSWHPQYECYSHQVRHHQTGRLGDDESEWVATSVLRKR